MNPYQTWLDTAYVAVGWMANISAVCYAPFAKRWLRALVVQAIIALSWVILRATADVRFNEDAGPGIVYLTVFAESLLWASILRGLKLLLFRIPVLRRLETRLRSP